MLDSAQADKRNKENLDLEYYTNPYQKTPQYSNGLGSAEKEHNYQLEYMRLYIANVVLTQQLKELLQEKGDLIIRLNKIECRRNYEFRQSETPLEDSYDERKRRLRRPACEINRHYQCPEKNCQKSYGSEGSLNQHLKLKHPHLLITSISQQGNSELCQDNQYLYSSNISTSRRQKK